MKIQVENIKCSGCANTITKKINSHFLLNSTKVDVENGIIEVELTEDKKDELLTLLLKIGYPEVGSTEGLRAIKAKAKSFVSCAIGKINK